jgi:hypothetical protein
MVAAALAGCSTDESDPTQAFCNGFGAGSTVVFNSCTNCTPANPGNAGDGNLSTETSIVPAGGSSSETFVMTATSTANIAGGTIVGVWVTQPSNLTGFTSNFETFLDGNPQEVLNTDPQTGNGVVIVADEGTPAAGFIGMRTTQAFDQVRFTRTNQYTAGTDPVYRVYEICSDGGAS